jgi:hypothetical protein
VGENGDPRNHGVVEDLRVKTRACHPLRLICYVDPVTEKAYEFLTNESLSEPPVVRGLRGQVAG